MSGEKRQNFLKSAMVLVAANFTVKVIGGLFKVPLQNLIGDDGMGFFNVSYQIYTFMFIIATAGFPVAVSKMVSESIAKGNEKDARRVFKASLLLLGIIGLTGSTVLFAFAAPLAGLIGNTGAYAGIIVISPSIFFISLVSSYRGYFQGRQNMYPTAVSEVVEAMSKLIIGYFAAWYIMNLANTSELNIPIFQGNADITLKQFAAAGATFGVTCGAILALMVIMGIYVFSKKGKLSSTQNTKRMRTIMKELTLIAVPITIGASVSSLTSLIDLSTIMRRLVVNPDVLNQYAHIFNDTIINAEGKANAIYGMYTGKVVTMFNLPLTIVVALSLSVVPAIAAAMALNNRKGARETTQSALRITMLFALPCAVGMSMLAEPILKLLYKGNPAGAELLQILSVAIVFVSLVSVSNAVLQAYGKVHVPVVNMVAGGMAKIVMNFSLIPIMGISAAPVATTVCYAIITVLNLYYIARYVGLSFNLVQSIINPLICTFAMGAAVFLCDRILVSFIPYKLATLASIGIGGVVYIILILVIGCVQRRDVEMLPYGVKIADKLERARLLR